MDGTSDETRWIEQAKRGDGAAFERIYLLYERKIYSHIYRMMGNPDDASDLTQTTFIKAYENLAKTAPDSNVGAWLYRIASNTCYDQLRRKKRVQWQPWEDAKHDHLLHGSVAENPERGTLRREAEDAVQQVLNRMSPQNRQALLLREDGMGLDDIGLVLGKSRSAMKSLLFRAREEFRKIAVEMGLDASLEDEEA